MASPKTQYLIAYNAVSAVLWLVLLSRVLALLPVEGPAHVFSHVGEYTRWTQTAAVAEILHSAFGVVRAPLFTTIMQVASRLFVVHAIVQPYSNVAGETNPFYASMLLAWSVTEVIRYSFFVHTLSTAPSSGKSAKDGKSTVPAQNSALGTVLTWLRYNTFFVLYPVGISSEVMCIWRAMGQMKKLARSSVGTSGDGLFGLQWWGCVVVLAFYVPGSWVLYTYMMAQRRKVVGGAQKTTKKAKKTN